MSRIDDLLARHCPGGVVFLPTGVVAEVLSGATPSKAVAEYWDGGTIPWLSSGEVNKGTIYSADTLISQQAYDSCSTKMVPSRTVVMALAGQGKTRGMVARTRLECCTNQSLASIIPSEAVDSDFLYHFLRTQYVRLREISSGDGTRGGLNLGMIRAFKIPVPPLAIQRDIASILDKMESLKAELEAELEAELDLRGRQYAFYRTQLLNFPGSAIRHASLGEVAEYVNGKAHEKLVTADGEIPLATARFISRNGEANRFVPREDVLTPVLEGDVALVLSDLPNGRALARTYFVDRDGSVAINQRIARLRVLDRRHLSPRFLFHVLDRNPGLLRHDNGVDQTHLSKGQVIGLPIPVPPLAEQERTVAILDKFHALVNDLSVGLPAEIAARRKQYEYYRDKLLAFEEAA